MTEIKSTHIGLLYTKQYNAAKPLRIGTRQSPLAMKQAQMVRTRLIEHYNMNDAAIILVPMQSGGDKAIDRPLAEIGGKAIWTKELERAQIEGDIDIAVHSMKDVETIRPNVDNDIYFAIAAMLPRADTCDRLIGASSLDSLAQGAKIGTSSPRRKAQLLSIRPDFICETIRGNVATRLSKIENGEYDATLLAAAGLNRLDMDNLGTPIDNILPAASQGAIGIECLSSKQELVQFINGINHPDTMDCVHSERHFLAALGGGCHSPIAALAIIKNDQIYLRGQILSGDGGEQQTGGITSNRQDIQSAAQTLAMQLYNQASDTLKSFFAPLSA